MYVLDMLVHPVVMVLAIIMTVRAGRGYGFGILSLLLLVCTFLDLFLPLPRPSSLGGGMLWAIVRSGAPQSDVVATVALLIGAAIVAGIDRQWGWLGGLIVAGLVAAVAATLPLSFWGMASDPAVQQQGIRVLFLGQVVTALLAIPQAAVLAYSIARIVHSTRARQPTPSASS